MALIVEDGTLVEGATSFVSVAEIRAYAAARGRTVPAEDAPGDTKIEQAAIVAMDFIQALATRFAGSFTYDGQYLPFPRYGMRVGGVYLAKDAIPEDIKRAQIELALAVLDGIDIMPTLDGAEVKREKVGPLETEYVTGTARGNAPIVERAMALLRPYFATISLRTVRA